ncbi:hypothetical protein FRC00_011535 [Tulasnella sp. 408]|nr:hypothetical protein FRC00_011535 [Tulasnella sp. 408]
MFNEQHHLPLFQYNTAYFNPYEVKHRKRTSRAQLTVLEATFQENNKPSSAVKKALAAQLDMPIRNVQVWFQNRRAKDKNLAAKAKAKEAAAAAAADQAAREGGEDDDLDDEDLSGDLEASTPPAASSSSSGNSTLSPPSNLGLRRGSAPNLGGNTPPDFASSTSTFKIRPSPPQAPRSASDSVRTINNPIIAPPTPVDANIPATVNLGRRKSLPAFHPSLQRPGGVPQIPSLPTVADVNRLSKSPEADAKRIALGSAGPGSGDDMGHGGVYRSASSSRLSAAAAAPYPTPSSRGSSGNLMTYRSGSTPGTGVFRIPANPNPAHQSWQGTSTVNSSEDASFPGGLRQQPSSAPTDNNANQPYSFPPRPYGDIPRAGPLPSKDFVFGDSGGTASSVGTLRDSPPSTTNEDEEERLHGLSQSHRFGSFASEFSIESDATGTTATTATSTDFSPLALGAPHVPPSAFRTRYPPAFGRGPGLGHANTDSGLAPSISYGMSSGSVAGLPGLSAGPVSYPSKFDPESRRASCTASDTTSHGTASSPEIYYHPSGSGQHSSSLENSSFPNSLPNNPAHPQPNLLDANLTYPVYMPNLTQEPVFDNSLFYNNASQQNSQPQLVDSQLPYPTDNFQTQQPIFDPTFPLTGYNASTANQPVQQPVGGFEAQQQPQATSAYANSNSSFTSFLHAPVPAPSSSSSSLAGALAPENNSLNQQQW